MILSVATAKVSYCLIHTAMSQENVSRRVLTCGRLVAFLRTNVVNQSQYLVTAFSGPSLMRILDCFDAILYHG